MVSDIVGFFSLGAFLGVLVGFYGYRELSRLVSRHRGGHGACELCGTEAYVTSCRRCRRQVAMCCYFTVLSKDIPDPAKLRARRSIQVCVNCLAPDEKEILERMVEQGS